MLCLLWDIRKTIKEHINSKPEVENIRGRLYKVESLEELDEMEASIEGDDEYRNDLVSASFWYRLKFSKASHQQEEGPSVL